MNKEIKNKETYIHDHLSFSLVLAFLHNKERQKIVARINNLSIYFSIEIVQPLLLKLFNS